MLSTKPSTSKATKTTLFHRLTKFLLPAKKARFAGSLPPMTQQRDGNPLPTPSYQRLYVPEEQHEGYEEQKQSLYYSAATPEIPPRILTGPVPKRPLGDHQTIQTDPSLAAFALEASLAFLTPVEAEILELLIHTKRASQFRPILEPQSPILLVKPKDKRPLEKVRDLVRELPDEEKALLERDLKAHLLPNQRFVLAVLLWNEKTLISTHTRGTRMEFEEGSQRPDSVAMFGPWRREWDDGPSVDGGFRSMMVDVDEEE